MAEQQFPQYRPVRRQQVGLNLPGASVTPAASPVDTYFRTNLPEPSKSNEMLELAGALAPFSKSLGNYLQFEMQNQQEEAKIQAEMDVKEWSAEQVKDFLEMSQEELKASGLLSGPVANRPDYYIAAKINAGKRLGDIAQQDIITKHGEMLADLTDPSKEINIAEALGGIRQEVMGEFGELGFYSQKGAAASIEPLIDSLTKKTIAARQERVEEENIENLTVGFVKAYTAVAADEIATPGEIQMLMGITQAQLEKYKAVGGKKPQDILFDSLERAAGELVEDGSESVAVALMEMARTTLGPGGKPLAKPGTKAHERLLELEDKIEKKAEENRNKDRREYREKNIVAEEKAADVVAGFYNDRPVGTDLTPEIEAEIRQVFEAEGLDGSAANSFIFNEREKAKERQSVTTDMETYRSFERRLADGEVIPAGELVDALGVTLSMQDFQRLKTANEANKETPERKAEQDDTWKAFSVEVLGAGGINSYTDESKESLNRKLTAAKRAYRREAAAARKSGDWDTFLDRWSAGGAAVTRFRQEAEEALKFRKDRLPEFLMETGQVAEQHNLFMKTLAGPEGGTDSLTMELQAAAQDAWDSRLPDAIAWAELNSTRDSQIPGKVAQYMRMNSTAMRNEITMKSAVGEQAELRTEVMTDLERTAEDRLPGKEFLNENLGVNRFKERLREKFIELRKKALGQTYDQDVIDRANTEMFGPGMSGAPELTNLQEVLGAFIDSGGKEIPPQEMRRVMGRADLPELARWKIEDGRLVSMSGFGFTLAEARELLPTTYIATGLDADAVIAGEIPTGMTVDTIKPSLTRLFRDRAHFETFNDSIKNIPKDISDAEYQKALNESLVGRLVAALGLRTTTADNKWTAQILMQHQDQLLED